MTIITQLPNTETRYEGIAAPTQIDPLAGVTSEFMLALACEISRLWDVEGDLWADAAQVSREHSCYDTVEEWQTDLASLEEEARKFGQTATFLQGLAHRHMAMPLDQMAPTPSEILWAFEDIEPF